MKDKVIERIVGRNIHSYYKASGLNITSFANLIGVNDTTYVRRIFEGTVSIGIGKLGKIAEALEVKVIDLVEDWSDLNT